MKLLSQLSQPIYEALKQGGLLGEVYPEASGEWEQDRARPSVFPWVSEVVALPLRQGCRSYVYCPECNQLITDGVCMCMGTCEKHGLRLIDDQIPDGDYEVRHQGRAPSGNWRRIKGGQEIAFKRSDSGWFVKDASSKTGWAELPMEL